MHIATKSSKIDITIEKDTKSISQNISSYLLKGDIIFLYGEIGVGKTTFIRHLINHLQVKSNVKETEVPSPTFSLLNEYQIKNLTIQHYDLYRVKNGLELQNIGLFENYKEAIIFVEWPEIIKDKPKNRIELIFNYEENLKKRSLVICSDFRKEIIDEYK
jgi:tRNA threonylcarbamoyl adenosine modification protein YjeE